MVDRCHEPQSRNLRRTDTPTQLRQGGRCHRCMFHYTRIVRQAVDDLPGLQQLDDLTVALATVLGLLMAGEAATKNVQGYLMDKTGTTRGSANHLAAEMLTDKLLAAAFSFVAEGMGVEPTTPCGAPDFESGR